MANDDLNSLSDVLDRVETKAEDCSEEMSVGDALEALGFRAFGPIFFMLGVISASPLGAIPGASVVIGALLITFAGQMALRARTIWAPESLSALTFGAEKMQNAVNWLRPYIERFEKFVRPRQEWVTRKPWVYVTAGHVLLQGLLMFPLALAPWGVLIPSLAVAMLGAGLTNRDGALTLIAHAVGLASLAGGIYAVLSL